MKRKLLIILATILLVSLFLSACNSTDKSQTETQENNGNSQTSGNDGNNQHTTDSDDIYTKLFDINNKIQINIDITDEELAKLQADYEKYSAMNSKSPIYRDTALSITITTKDGEEKYDFENVGIRMKGNTSRTDFYSEKDGIYNLIHFRIEFPEKFAGLEHLELRWNKLDDSTYIREYYAYEFFRENGILAPHTNLASVDVAGIHEGVFTIVEPIDKIFLERNLPEEDWDGDLYKACWTWQGAKLTSDMTIGIEDEEKGEFYNYDLKNNKKTSEHELMKNLIEKLNSDNVTKEILEEVVDMDYFLKFAAVSYFAGNPDDIRYDYNNYYVYFLKSNDKAIFIPYDNDRCFGVTKEWNPTGDGMTGVNPFSTMADGAVSKQENPLFIHTVDAGGLYIDEYVKSLNEVSKSKWLTSEKFDEIYDIAYDNYKDDAKPSKNFFNASWHKFKFDNASSEGLYSVMGNASFKDYIEAKMKNFNNFIADVDKYANASGENDTDTQEPNDNKKPTDTGAGYYIRGGFNNWEKDDEYLMSYDSATDTYSYIFEAKWEEWLKISSSNDMHWYGYKNISVMPKENVVTYDEEHYNIILAPGKYKIIFRGTSKEIEISLTM